MAARKSCTHLTWSQAKAKDGSSSDTPGVAKKKGEKPKKLNQTEKVIAKNSLSVEEEKRIKAALKQQRRQEEKLAELAEKKRLERQRLRDSQARVRPATLAKERQQQRAADCAAEDNGENNNNDNKCTTASSLVAKFSGSPPLPQDLDLICQSKQMQLSELLALEAMLNSDGADVFVVCQASQRHVLESYCEEEDLTSPVIQEKVARHPPLSYVLQLTIKDEEQKLCSSSSATNDNDNEDEFRDLVAFCVLQITLPPGYPLVEEPQQQQDEDDHKHSNNVPLVEMVSFECFDENLEINADKPIESMADLDHASLLRDLRQQFTNIIPEVAIYEVCVTWLSEHLLDYCQRNYRYI
ncbi:hypothetical protein ACA910_016226 [Epithemia clementina (nom. ined.)]